MTYRDDREAELCKLRAENEELRTKLSTFKKVETAPLEKPSAPWVNTSQYVSGTARLEIEFWKEQQKRAEARKEALSSHDEEIWTQYFQAILTGSPKDGVDIAASKADSAVQEHRRRFK